MAEKVSEISIRGTQSNHTTIKDGARLNSQNHLANLSIIFDSSDLEQRNFKGPASVQYGTDAIGGVVQI